jgi:hypothetical protein
MIQAFVKKSFPDAKCEGCWIGPPPTYVNRIVTGDGATIGTGIDADAAWTAAATYCLVKLSIKQGKK